MDPLKSFDQISHLLQSVLVELNNAKTQIANNQQQIESVKSEFTSSSNTINDCLDNKCDQFDVEAILDNRFEKSTFLTQLEVIELNLDDNHDKANVEIIVEGTIDDKLTSTIFSVTDIAHENTIGITISKVANATSIENDFDSPNVNMTNLFHPPTNTPVTDKRSDVTTILSSMTRTLFWRFLPINVSVMFDSPLKVIAALHKAYIS